jgi:hypothetical protein
MRRWQVIEPFPSLHPLHSGIHHEPTSREVLHEREDCFPEAKAISYVGNYEHRSGAAEL